MPLENEQNEIQKKILHKNDNNNNTKEVVPTKMNLLEEDFNSNVEREALPPALRKITLEDFQASLQEVRASVSEDAFSVAELRRWDSQYGAGAEGIRLSYFM